MTIVLVLLTFLAIGTATYLAQSHRLHAAPKEAKPAQPLIPIMAGEAGFDVPVGYRFHPGHTWLCGDGGEHVRIGIDSFATKVFGKVDHLEVSGLSRWVRQGNRLCSITREGTTAHFMSPIEGVIVAVNHEVQRDPNLIVADPYKDGWICIVKSPDMDINLKNLLPQALVGTWMQNGLRRLQAFAAPLGAATADGGVPIDGLIAHVDPDVRCGMIHEFFLN